MTTMLEAAITRPDRRDRAADVDLRGRVALVTGGGRGVGRLLARTLAEAGAAVALIARSSDELAMSVEQIQDAGGVAVAASADVTDEPAVTAALAQLRAQLGPVDVLINNAGIYPDEGVNILSVAREQLVTTFQTNAFGALRVVQEFLPYLQKSGEARIINVSSGYGALDGLSADVPSYCLSKLTLNGITIMLNDALRSRRIAVNSVCPGWVRTDMGGPGATRSVEEGADTIVWLASEAPSSLTGSFIRDRREIAW